MMMCSFGVSPSTLNVLPTNRTLCGAPAGTIMDFAPLMNIPTFGMCQSQANPAVLAATTAASGVPTPAPCVPVTAAPWISGSPTVLIGSLPALNSTSTCMCSYGGVISISYAGQVTTTVP
jgi:hypothetical protein